MKEQLKSLPIKELQQKLIELERDKFKLETKCIKSGGTIRSYPKERLNQQHGNIRTIRKDIARVKTWLNIKLKNGHD